MTWSMTKRKPLSIFLSVQETEDGSLCSLKEKCRTWLINFGSFFGINHLNYPQFDPKHWVQRGHRRRPKMLIIYSGGVWKQDLPRWKNIYHIWLCVNTAWTSINPSYFDVNCSGTGFWHILFFSQDIYIRMYLTIYLFCFILFSSISFDLFMYMVSLRHPFRAITVRFSLRSRSCGSFAHWGSSANCAWCCLVFSRTRWLPIEGGKGARKIVVKWDWYHDISLRNDKYIGMFHWEMINTLGQNYWDLLGISRRNLLGRTF
jgi:hypothetical protein